MTHAIGAVSRVDPELAEGLRVIRHLWLTSFRHAAQREPGREHIDALTALLERDQKQYERRHVHLLVERMRQASTSGAQWHRVDVSLPEVLDAG